MTICVSIKQPSRTNQGSVSWVLFTPVFRPGLLNPYSFSGLAFKKLCHHYLDQNSNKKDFLKSISNFHIFLSFQLSFGNELINTFKQTRISVQNHSRFQTKIGKVYIPFKTKTPKKPYTLAAHTYIAYSREYPPRPPPRPR